MKEFLKLVKSALLSFDSVFAGVSLRNDQITDKLKHHSPAQPLLQDSHPKTPFGAYLATVETSGLTLTFRQLPSLEL